MDYAVSITLYEMAADYAELALLLDQAGGPEEEAAIQAKLDSLHDDIEVKVDRCSAIVTGLWGEAEIIKGEMDRLRARKAALDHNADRLIAYVKREMETANLQKLKGPRFSATIQKSPPKCVIDDEAKVPASFWKEKIERVVDKIALLEKLKAGEVVEGAHVVQESRLQIR